MDKPDLNFLTAEDAENAEGNYALANFFPLWIYTFDGGERPVRNKFLEEKTF
jgi:hypothetical protein